ncbi:MAG: hypothetical protein GYB66_00320 [Chloroflexi bacterium]|nr:hypothetical protein [Chloroflexota bacterium]
MIPRQSKPSKAYRQRPRRRYRWLYRLLLIQFVAALFTFGLGVGIVEANDGMRGTRCVVDEDEYIEHDFYFFCRSLTVRGTIEGDLIGIASDVTITSQGQVMGDIWMAGGQLTIKGRVTDDVRFGGADLDIEQPAAFVNPRADVTALALTVEIASGTRVPGDLAMMGYQALVYGDVGGNIDFQGQALDIQGRIGNDVYAIVGDSRTDVNLRTIPFIPYSIRFHDYGLYVADGAVIRGNLRYEAAQSANIPRGAVEGTTRYTQVIEQADITTIQRPQTFFTIMRNYVVDVLQEVIGLLIIGVLLLQFMPSMIVQSSQHLRSAIIPAVSWGLMIAILFFPIALLMLITSIILVVLTALVTLSSLTVVVGILMAIINLTVALGFWILFYYVGRAITCFFIGYGVIQGVRHYLARRNHDPDDPPIYVPPIPTRFRWATLALGTVLYAMVINVPLPSPVPTVAVFLDASVALTGFGALFILARDAWYRYEMRRGTKPVRGRPDFDADLIEDTDAPLGMDNLPAGFKGFYD